MRLTRGSKMKSRKIISGLVLVALVAILFFVPSLVFAEKKTVYNIGGKYVSELPNIKWEDGDAGADPSGKVNFLGSSNSNNLLGNHETYTSIDDYSVKEAILNNSNLFRKLLWRSIIFRIILNF